MRDAHSIAVVQKLHPKVRDEVAVLIEKVEAGWPVTIAVRVVQGLRTIEEQNDLYVQGRTKPGKIVTNAKGGSSFHNYGLAIDFAILYDKDGNGSYETLSWDTAKDGDHDGLKDWIEVVTVFKNGGYEWGGEWHSIKDYPHLQKTFGHSWHDLLEMYNTGKFIPGTKYVAV